MNYLERLMRRAMLEAPKARPNEASDPFETELPWLPESSIFDNAASDSEPRQPKSAERYRAPAAEAATRPSIVTNRTAAAQSREPAPQNIAEKINAALSHPARTLPNAPIETVATIVESSPRRSFSATPALDPLTQADAFMRSLGLDLPDTDFPDIPNTMPAPQTATDDAEQSLAAPRQIPPIAVEPQPLDPPPAETSINRLRPTPHPAIQTSPALPPRSPAPQAGQAPTKAPPVPGKTQIPKAFPDVRVVAVHTVEPASAAAWLAESARFGLEQL